MTLSLKLYLGYRFNMKWKSGKMKLKFTLASISYNPVSASKFEIPKSGYSVLTYAETNKNRRLRFEPFR